MLSQEVTESASTFQGWNLLSMLGSLLQNLVASCNHYRVRRNLRIGRVVAEIKAMEEMQKRIVPRLDAGDCPSDIAKAFKIGRQAIYRAKKIDDEIGGYSKRVQGGRPRTAWTPAVISSIKAKIARNPSCSIRKLAKDSNISATSMRTLIKANRGMKSEDPGAMPDAHSKAETEESQLCPVNP